MRVARVITTTRSVGGLIGSDCDEGKGEGEEQRWGERLWVREDQDCETSLRDLGCVA
jgi:hypothetical protein